MTVPLPPMPPPSCPFMSGFDLPGGNIPGGTHTVNYTDPVVCQASCDANSNCMAWNFVVRTDSTTACVLKQHGFRSPQTCTSCTSGIKPTPGAVGGLWTIGFRASAPAQLLHATAWGMAGIRTSPAVLMD
jgi:hypothetical protein